MTKLTQAQHGLRAAAEADDGSIDAPADRKTFSTLIKKGLFISVPQAEGGSRLMITEAGRAEVCQDTPVPHPDPEPEVAPTEPVPEVTPKGKIGILVEMLRRADGVSIQAMMAATGWQAHSVRGAISGSIKKALGLNVLSEKTDAGRFYRIAPGTEA